MSLANKIKELDWKKLIKNHLPEIVFFGEFLTIFFLVYRYWNFISIALLLITAFFAIVFTGGIGRISIAAIAGLWGIIERHFITHYSACIDEAGGQALITLQITDSNEVWSYVCSLFPVEYFLLTIWLIAIVYFIISFHKKSTVHTWWGTTIAILFLLLCIYSNVHHPINNFLKEKKEQRDYYTQINAHTFNAVSSRPGIKEFALLVIGESHRYDAMDDLLKAHAFKNFAECQEQGTLYSFSDMITCYPQTYFSVFTLLSRRSPDSQNPYWPQHGLLTLFREAGWHVCYLTYQNKNLKEYGYDKVVNEGNEYINHRHTSNTKLDTGMLPIIREKIQNNTGKLLIVVKMTGCHFHFASPHRYPDSARIYLPDGRYEKSNPLSGKQEDIMKMKNAYKNAILFSGSFIDAILGYVREEQTPGLMIFLSDHGVINYDDGNNAYFGKAKSNYHIPAYLFFNNSYRQQLLTKDIEDNLTKNQGQPMINSCIFDTLEHLTGITDHEMRYEYIISSDSFKPQTERYVWLWNKIILYNDL